MSAKLMIDNIMKQYYSRAKNAKENGEKVGWVTSNFPQEIIQTMDLAVIYPENHSATIATNGFDKLYCEKAEAAGFSNDICSYARVNLGYSIDKGDIEEEIPLPDYLLCCSNICHQLLKWYQYLSKTLGIPMIVIDIPYNTEYETDETRLEYIKIQFYEAIDEITQITGRQFEEEKFKEVMNISSKVGYTWNKISDLLVKDPAVFRGTDLFAYMGVVVCQRGRRETLDALEELYRELTEQGDKTHKVPSRRKKYRIMYEGICCWPAMMKIAVCLSRFGMNMTGAVYTNTYGIEYEDFNDMLRAYTYVPNAVSFERAKDMRINEIEKKSCEGVLIHMSRTCKIWSGIMYEMKKQIEEKKGIPVVTFDGDQADAQCFSDAQFDTRLQGFYELISGR